MYLSTVKVGPRQAGLSCPNSSRSANPHWRTLYPGALDSSDEPAAREWVRYNVELRATRQARPQRIGCGESITLTAHCRPSARAPSKARPCQPGAGPGSGRPGQSRIPSVAWPKVTTVMKRTQRVDGPQCVSVKGLSPVMNRELWVPTWLATWKARSEGPRAKAPANPPGSKTVARQQGRAGNSGDPMRSSSQG